MALRYLDEVEISPVEIMDAWKASGNSDPDPQQSYKVALLRQVVISKPQEE